MTWTLYHIKKLQEQGKIRFYSVEVEVKKRSKYGNKKTIVRGRLFDSKKEGNRFMNLLLQELAGEISALSLQVEFQLSVCKYFCDFLYIRNGSLVVEDTKSPATRRQSTYRLKKKLMKEEFGITITEV